MINRVLNRTALCALKRKVELVLGAALVSVVLTACGGGGDDSSAAAAPSSGPPPVASGPSSSQGDSAVANPSPGSSSATGETVIVASVPGTTTLSWTPPTMNADGTPLSLTGYRIYWGQQKDYYTSSVTLDNPGLTRYVIEQLEPAKYYFVATALSARGESDFSNVVAMQIL
jgi:hypothetical protein